MSKTERIIGVPWSFAEVWNHTLDHEEPRPMVPRDYIYASELGQPFCDRYLKMYGVKPTNPPNTRSKRKFQAGNIWEWVVGMVLISAGMLRKKQLRVESKSGRYLRVSGRLDYVVGAPEDWKKAAESIKSMRENLELLGLDIPPFFYSAIEKFTDKYAGKPLMEVVLETKAISSFASEKVQKTNAPLYQHALQIYHYVVGNDAGIREGKLFYVCKDDCILSEFDIVADDADLAKIYVEDIKAMTKHYKAGFDKRNPTKFMPPVEPMVLFEEGLWKFQKNLSVEYSPYLTMLYNYETPEAYRMAWQSRVASWNRVFKRHVLEGTAIKRDGKSDLIMKLTDKNKDVINEAKIYFKDWDKMVAKARAAGAFNQEEEEDEE